MKKTVSLIFTIFCVAVCAVPSLGMVFRPSNQPIGNERREEAPSLTNEDGGFNFSYFSQLGSYYEKNFAFRPEMIQADARINAGLFKTSNIDTVIVGKNDWLYYTSTADDYLGKNTLTQSEINGVVNNLKIIQSYCESVGVQFLFTAAPNKNTLYHDNMPYTYSAEVSSTRNRDLLHAALNGSTVNYCNLFEPLSAQSETLYFARDSHWNNKGALLAYNTVLDALNKTHDDYSSAEVTRKKDFTGDLSKMIYPVSSEPEYNYYYGAEDKYSYVTNTKSVEENMIKTSNPDAAGTLFMYRDSFGNARVPFFASAYENATFTKAFPMNIRQGLDSNKPDTFVMELAERNIKWLVTMPPMVPAQELSLLKTSGTVKGIAKVSVQPCTYASEYTQVSAVIDSSEIDDDAQYYFTVKDKSGAEKTFEALYSKTDGGNGCIAYLPAESFPAQEKYEIKISVKNKDGFFELGS